MNTNKRRIRARAVKQQKPDLRKIARAIIDLSIELDDVGAEKAVDSGKQAA